MRNFFQVFKEALKCFFSGILDFFSKKKIIIKSSKHTKVDKNKNCNIKISKSEDVNVEGNINS